MWGQSKIKSRMGLSVMGTFCFVHLAVSFICYNLCVSFICYDLMSSCNFGLNCVMLAALTLASPPQWTRWRGWGRPTAHCRSGTHIYSTPWAWRPPPLCRSIGTALWINYKSRRTETWKEKLKDSDVAHTAFWSNTKGSVIPCQNTNETFFIKESTDLM